MLIVCWGRTSDFGAVHIGDSRPLWARESPQLDVDIRKKVAHVPGLAGLWGRVGVAGSRWSLAIGEGRLMIVQVSTRSLELETQPYICKPEIDIHHLDKYGGLADVFEDALVRINARGGDGRRMGNGPETGCFEQCYGRPLPILREVGRKEGPRTIVSASAYKGTG